MNGQRVEKGRTEKVTEADPSPPPARGIDELLAVLRDPVAWGERTLVNRDKNPRKYWKHQAEDLRCEAGHIIRVKKGVASKSVVPLKFACKPYFKINCLGERARPESRASTVR